MDQNILRQIPKMDKLLERPAIQAAAEGLPAPAVRETLRRTLEQLRAELLSGSPLPTPEQLDSRLCGEIQRGNRFGLRRLVNATGILLHTNLGRAPLGQEIAAHVAEVAAGYSNLEYDLEAGHRGSRIDAVAAELCRLTGAEAALVVNNNAAAVFLMLNTLARGKKTAISRGELVEIGGSFRIPEIMDASGAQLMEIGTTNKTHPFDYQRALEEGAEVLLKTHTSNFRICGFTEQTGLPELRVLADRFQVPLLYDLGAALMLPPDRLGLAEGVWVQESVRQCDVVCFSGDKLLGAGQAGILLGKKRWIEAMKKNQLTRMLRVDKMTLAALEAVLRWYGDPEEAKAHIPVLKMCSADPQSLELSARQMTKKLAECCPLCRFEAIPCMDTWGGGALPGTELPGWAVAVSCEQVSPDGLDAFLRARDVPVIGRIHQGKYLLAMRTLLSDDPEDIVSAFCALETDLSQAGARP